MPAAVAVSAAHVAGPAAVAFASALAFAAATVAQQRSAAQSSDADARGGHFLGQLLRNRLWLAGTAGTAVGYGLQALALGLGSVLVVQPILVTSLLFALPLGAFLAHQRLRRSAAATGSVLGVSLGVFLVLGNPDRGVSHGSGVGWALVAAIAVPVVVGCLVVANPRSGGLRAGLLAVAVGVMGGVLAVLTKAVVASAGQGVGHLLTSGETYGLVVVGLGGVYLQQLSFQAGALQTSLPVMTVLEPVVAVALGLTLLHERLDVSGARLAALLVAAAVMTVATVALARESAQAVTSEPVAGPGKQRTAPHP